MKLFGSNGVRGIANKEFTLELASCLAASTGHLLGKNIGVGRDGRTTSPMFRNAVVSALLSIGCNVHDFGLITTPCLQFMIRKKELHGGIMITASHNPPQFNGVKIIYSDGVEIPKTLEKKIETLVAKGGPPPCEWNEIGTVQIHRCLDPYIDSVLNNVDAEAIRKAGLSVCLDYGNGASVLTVPIIARKLGCQVYSINSEIDGEFSGRGSEPTPNNLKELKELIKATDSDLGVGFDGDGDRSIIIDERGNAVWGDKTLSLVAQEFMKTHRGETLVTAISSSPSIQNTVAKYDGRVVWTKVGSVIVSREMVENGYPIGGEENGGIMYGPHLAVRDGGMALALMLHYIASRKIPLSALIDEQPHLVKNKVKTPCPDHLKKDVLRILVDTVEAPEISTLDGIKIVYGDGSWVLVRPSGTEPVFRIYAEATKEPRVRELIKKHLNTIEKIVAQLTVA